MKVALLGYGAQGQTALEYWNTPDNQVTVCDRNPVENLPAGVDSHLGPDYLNDLHEFDLLVRTPGLHPREIAANNTDHPEVMDRVTSVTNEFMRVCPAPVIAVTGTKGKGTTSSLIAEILKASGHRVHLGGNIGIPPLELLKNNIQPGDWVVLELANFQLIDLQHGPHIAVCLMVAPEHLDWHTDMYEYQTAKQQLFTHQTKHDLAVFNASNLYSEDIASVSAAIKQTYQVLPLGQEPDELRGAYVKGSHIYMAGMKICSINDVRLPGRHNLENVCAAIAATWHLIKGNVAVIQNVVKSFGGLEHRIETVREVNHIWYVNDSFAANPSATIAAIAAIPRPKVLIVGGFERGIPLDELLEAIAEHRKSIRHIVLIGASRLRVAESLKNSGFTSFSLLEATTMPEVVAAATAQAKKGDVVMLSPGFPSFDMFKNFEDRGNQFKAVVSKL